MLYIHCLSCQSSESLHHYFYYAYRQIYEVRLLVNVIQIVRNVWYLQYQDLHHYVAANLQSEFT